MATVEIMFNTSFCAVPAFIRVEPVIASGPTTGTIAISTDLVSADSGLHTIAAVKQPIDRAYSTAPIVYGVRPEAAIPTTASPAATPRARRSATAASLLSSLDSVALYSAS